MFFRAPIVLAMLLIANQVLADGVLVFGGTGKLGAYHVRLLAQGDPPVAVFHRPTSTFERLEGLQYARAEGDLMDGETVLTAMERIRPRAVIDTSARRGRRMRANEPYYAPAMEHIVAASVATGVEHIIIHSSIGVRDSAAPLKEKYGYDTDNPNMQDKAEAERILEQSGVNYTIIRNGLLDYEPAPATGGGRLTEDQTAFGRITRADLSRLAITCVGNPECYGKIFHAVDDSLVGPRRSPPGE